MTRGSNILNRDIYLEDCLRISYKEEYLIRKFEEWLPDKIIDAHVHSNLHEDVNNVPKKTYDHMISTFPYFSIEENTKINKIFHPTKNIQSLRMPMVFRGIDHKKANDYLLINSPETDRVAMFGLPEDLEYTIDILEKKKVGALKMYYSYTDPSAKKVSQVYNRELLKYVETLDIPIILHVPTSITVCYPEIAHIAKEHSKLKIVIPHLGSSKFKIPGLYDAFRELSVYSNVYLDTSLNPSADVFILALDTFGKDKIIYGSDAALNLIRSVSYIHPTKGQQIVSKFIYHWQDLDDHRNYSKLANNAPHSHWAALNAIYDSVESFPRKDIKTIKKSIFFDNAKEVYKF